MPRLVYEIRGRRFTSNYLKKVRKATTHFEEGDIVTHDRAARSNAPSPPFLHHAMRVYMFTTAAGRKWTRARVMMSGSPDLGLGAINIRSTQ
jgi:hypothetical protein